MCDEGRLTYQQMNEREQRLAKPMGRVKGKLLQVTWQQLYDAVADRLEALKPNGEQVVALVDTHSTLEEMFLLRRLLQEVSLLIKSFIHSRTGHSRNQNFY